MKILLIRPNHQYFKGSMSIKTNIPLGLLYVAASIEKAGHDVEIFDSLASPFTQQWRRKDITFYGIKRKHLIKIIKKEKPDLIGMSVLFTAQCMGLNEFANIIKKNFPNLPIVVGGPHVSASGAEYIKANISIDYGILGEGEETICELIDSLLGKVKIENVKGLIWKKNNQVIQNEKRAPIENIDSIAFPAYHKINLKRYFNLQKSGIKGRALAKQNNIPVITSRGCPFKCSFCSIHLHMGSRFRAHSAKYVLSHIQYLLQTYNVKDISFEDDNLTLNMKRFNHILDGILDKKIKFTWHTPNGVRADKLDRDMLIKMKKSGCRHLIIGVESGSERVITEVVNKNLDLKSVTKTAKLCKEIGIPLEAFFIIGLPGETIEEMKMTINFAYMLAKKYYCYPSLGIFTPLIATSLYQECLNKGYMPENFSPELLAKGNRPSSNAQIMIQTENFNREDVQKLINRLTLKINLLKKIRALMKRLLKIYEKFL